MALQFINTNNNPCYFEEVYFYSFNNVTNWYTIIITKLNLATMFTFIFSENLIALYRKLRQSIYWAHFGIRNCEPSLWTGKRSDFWRSANARSWTSKEHGAMLRSIENLFYNTIYLDVLEFSFTLTPFILGFYGAAHGWGEGQKGLPSLISVTNILQWWNLAQLNLTSGRSKNYMNHVTYPLNSADISIFSLEIRKFSYIKKYR